MRRYARYKPTGIPWLPEVPEGWECCRIKQVLIANDGGVWGSDPLDESDTIVLRSTEQEVDGTLKVVTPARRHLNESEICKALLKEGDLIITKSSGSAEHIGKTSLIDKATADLRCCYSNFLQRLRVNGEAKFYWYLFNSRITKKQFDFLCTTTTGLKNLNARIIGNVTFALPPLPEQQAIAAYLDSKCGKIDRLVAAKEKEVALLKELKQSMIAEAVTGKIKTHAEAQRGRGCGASRPMKPSGIPWLPEVPEGWEVKTLRQLLKMVSRKGFPEKRLLSVTREQGVIVRDVESKEENHNFIPDDLSNYKLVEIGDFAINKMKSWQGSYGVSDYEGIVSPAYYVCRLSGVNRKFFSIAIRSRIYVSFFARFSKGIRVDQWDLSTIGLKEIPFLFPPLPEQREIVAYIEARAAKIDAAVGKLEAEAAALKEYRERLVADVVTGQRKVAGSSRTNSGRMATSGEAR